MNRTGKKLKLGAILDGLGWNHVAWQHPEMPLDASENLDFYINRQSWQNLQNLIRCF